MMGCCYCANTLTFPGYLMYRNSCVCHALSALGRRGLSHALSIYSTVRNKPCCLNGEELQYLVWSLIICNVINEVHKQDGRDKEGERKDVKVH